MFCPKCGIQNPDTGKFCRSCGTDLGNIAEALSGTLPKPQNLIDHKGKKPSLDRAFGRIFLGVAFFIISVVLSFSPFGTDWWFWMLIPAFVLAGGGIGQLLQLRRSEKQNVLVLSENQVGIGTSEKPSLPPTQTEYIASDSRYNTGDLVPPSVTDRTTRHLEINAEGETMTLPKKQV